MNIQDVENLLARISSDDNTGDYLKKEVLCEQKSFTSSFLKYSSVLKKNVFNVGKFFDSILLCGTEITLSTR